MAFWGGVAALHLRGKGILSRTDLMLIRYGFILVCVISYLLTHWIWHMRGFGKYL